MSWLSSTRREVERQLDRYHDNDIHAAMLRDELEDLTGMYFSPDALADHIRECGAISDQLAHPEGYYDLYDVERTRRALIGVRADDAEAKTATMVARIIAAREIERGLLG